MVFTHRLLVPNNNYFDDNFFLFTETQQICFIIKSLQDQFYKVQLNHEIQRQASHYHNVDL